MKNIVVLLVIVLFNLSVFSQTKDSLIRVSDDVELIKISTNVYIHVSYTISEKWGRVSANGLLYTNKNQAFLFDTPWTNDQTETLITWIMDSMQLEIVGFIPNHWHNDCMGGLEAIQKYEITTYANQLTIDLGKAHELPVPEKGFADSLVLKLGDKQIDCYYLGAAHSTDNIVVWLPSEEILFAACMVKNIRSNNLGNTADGDLEAYPITLNRVMNKFPTAKVVIPGHGAYGGFELLEHTLKLTGGE